MATSLLEPKWAPPLHTWLGIHLSTLPEVEIACFNSVCTTSATHHRRDDPDDAVIGAYLAERLAPELGPSGVRTALQGMGKFLKRWSS